MTVAQRLVWAVICGCFVALAVAAPVKILRQRADAHRAARSAAAATAKGTLTSTLPAKSGTVTMYDLAFTPGTLTVARGATVVFENKDSAPHTVTDTAHNVDSGLLGPGKSFSLVVSTPLQYACTVHPGMHGRIELSG